MSLAYETRTVRHMTQDESWLLAEKYHGVATEDFLSDSARLQSGEPLAYVIGHVPFLNTTIFLNSKPLIPRVETEFWVAEALTEIKSLGRTSGEVRALDLCAGSGCIGVAVLHTLPYTTVDFVELDSNHHPTIRTNIEKNDIEVNRARIFGGDLFEEISDTYDYILTNPPYIDAKAKTVEGSVVAYEPHLALFGGTHGMHYIERIMSTLDKHLTPDGVLYIEHEPSQVETITDIAVQNNFVSTTHNDQYHVKRYTRITRAPQKKVS